MKKLCLIGLLLGSASVRAADLNIMQILQFSSYFDFSTADVPGAETIVTNFQPVYYVGSYFLDARLQNIGLDQWMFRGLFKANGVFLTNKYTPDFRYAYVENKKPVGNHWYISAGRINPMNLLPIQRLDGANVAYTPDPDKGWRFGLIGGMVPAETSGYRGLYYAPDRAGAYTEYSNKNSDHFKVQYNAGFGVGNNFFHQGQLEATKKYSIFDRDSFIRGGLMYTFPYNTIDYALAENSIYTSTKTIHTVGYLKSETLFLWQNQFIREDYQQAFYRFAYKSINDEWLFSFRGAYTYSLEKPGYSIQAQVMRNKLFEKGNGLLGLDLSAQQKGFYNQMSARANFGIMPLWVFNFNVNAGYEYLIYRTVVNDALLYGLNLQGELEGNLSYEFGVDLRTLFLNYNTDINASFILVHLFNTHLGKNENEVDTSESDKPLEKEENNKTDSPKEPE
jgi:hypothetical protein